MNVKRNQAIQKFGELTGAYTRLKAENDHLKNDVKKLLSDIDTKLDINKLARSLADKLKDENTNIDYKKIKKMCKDALDETQDFLSDIPKTVDDLLKNNQTLQERRLDINNPNAPLATHIVHYPADQSPLEIREDTHPG